VKQLNHEGDIPLTAAKPRQLGTLAIVALVALRIGTGWHFYSEGVAKLETGDFSSEGFLSTSHGPLAGLFKGLVWDEDGAIRLGYNQANGTISEKPTAERWNDYRARAVKRYQLKKPQQQAAVRAMKRRVGQLKWYLETNNEDIIHYFRQLERWRAQQRDASRRDVSTLRGQSESLAREISSSRRGWLATIEHLEADYQSDLAKLAVAGTKKAAAKPLKMKHPGRRFYDSRSVDRLLPYFDILVGVCLVVGLFSSTAAIAGACFLLSVVLTQFPGAVGAAPVYYQAVEALGLCLLAALRAGQYAGLDFFTYWLWRRSKRPKQGEAK
jgi:uncharacterized membrane protein YphA (DoxX/SURF4 family)